MKKKSVTSKVWSVKQSPMNPQRWCLTLDCNHEEWITSKSRPVRNAMRCSKCSASSPQTGGRDD